MTNRPTKPAAGTWEAAMLARFEKLIDTKINWKGHIGIMVAAQYLSLTQSFEIITKTGAVEVTSTDVDFFLKNNSSKPKEQAPESKTPVQVLKPTLLNMSVETTQTTSSKLNFEQIITAAKAQLQESEEQLGWVNNEIFEELKKMSTGKQNDRYLEELNKSGATMKENSLTRIKGIFMAEKILEDQKKFLGPGNQENKQ